QLAAALAALVALGIRQLPVIGLAKQSEEIHRANQPQPLRLPREAPALHLIQRLRDEAHRFAHAYHQTLRRRRLQESVLDELPGLGPKRKLRLLQQFGSMSRLRRARVAEVAAVPGIGPSLATRLRQFLDGS
ncbi:excinuclease ABC subunit UvrC, partial [bacterium]|nr:excinuclease ABC subunit UvrC [bacterium]